MHTSKYVWAAHLKPPKALPIRHDLFLVSLLALNEGHMVSVDTLILHYMQSSYASYHNKEGFAFIITKLGRAEHLPQ